MTRLAVEALREHGQSGPLTKKHALAGTSVNVWDVIDPIRSLITSGSHIDDVLFSNPDISLDRILP
ncbi:hypothetical protein [Streptomyces sp. NPDC097610]|uniref:hypothetical protein n=1 Tax=Streptomyces sp. NPDC097610 TaxID=3157227 RepID=UPI00332B46D3